MICYIMRSKMYTPNLPIGTAYLHLTPYPSIETTAEQHMLLVPDRRSVLQTYPAIPGPCAKMILLSIASHISRAAIPHPICFFAIGPESNEHAELQHSQCKLKYPEGTLKLTFPHGIWCRS
jgi:hypothetical protein